MSVRQKFLHFSARSMLFRFSLILEANDKFKIQLPHYSESTNDIWDSWCFIDLDGFPISKTVLVVLPH